MESPCDRVEELKAEGGRVVGHLVVHLPPWANADVRKKAIDAVLALPLAALADDLRRTLAAAAHKYAFARDGVAGKSTDGGLIFDISGRAEGETIVPARPMAAPSKPRK